MDVVVTREHTYFKRTCFIASTLTVHKFISYSSTGARPALHLLVMTDQYPIPNLLVVFFLQYCLMIFSSSLEGIYRQKQVTVIQTARTTLQITNFKHSWVWLQSSYVWCLQYFIKHIMTSSINLDLSFLFWNYVAGHPKKMQCYLFWKHLKSWGLWLTLSWYRQVWPFS